jgi:hypothetical protein
MPSKQLRSRTKWFRLGYQNWRNPYINWDDVVTLHPDGYITIDKLYINRGVQRNRFVISPTQPAEWAWALQYADVYDEFVGGSDA